MCIAVDKRALPFPEPEQLRLAARRPSFDQTALSTTEKTVAATWARHIPHVVSSRTIAPDDSFFDLGGHSLIAQYVMLDTRKELGGTNIPLSALFQHPTLRKFAAELDRLQDPIGLNLESADETNGDPVQLELYSDDRKQLTAQLPQEFPAYQANSGAKNVLLTGGTGFLGSHIIDMLVNDKTNFGRIIVHVRASDAKAGLQRIKNTCKAYGLKCDDRVSCITGDLGQPQLGMENHTWDNLSKVRIANSLRPSGHLIDNYILGSRCYYPQWRSSALGVGLFVPTSNECSINS
jgi:L-aminoadipate-semialdehyde dehydrogenase